MVDQSPARYAVWRERIAGGNSIVPTRENMAGYYRIHNSKPKEGESAWEAIAIFYDDDGTPTCMRQYFAGHIKKADYIEENIFAHCSIYPVPYNVYQSAIDTGEFAPLYQTRLPLNLAKQGTVWTAELGMQIMARADVKGYGKKAMAKAQAADPQAEDAAPSNAAPENERAVAGDNSEPMGVDQVFLGQVNDTRTEFNLWLKKIGGKVTSEQEKMMADGFVKKFQAMRIAAEKARVEEKEPHLEAGRNVDKKWKVVTAASDSNQKAAKDCQTDYLAALDRAKADEARKANEQAIAQRQAAPVGAPPARAPVSIPLVEVGVKMQDVEYVVIDDIEAVLKVYVTTPGAKKAAEEWAMRVGTSFDQPIPGTHIEIKKELK